MPSRLETIWIVTLNVLDVIGRRSHCKLHLKVKDYTGRGGGGRESHLPASFAQGKRSKSLEKGIVAKKIIHVRTAAIKTANGRIFCKGNKFAINFQIDHLEPNL
jgi:hypothetical protein